MRGLGTPLLALLCAAQGADAARTQELAVRVGRPRCYGGEAVSAHVRAHAAGGLVRWETSVAGAPIGRGEAGLPDGRVTLSVRAPEVRRIVDMTIRVQTPPEGPTASCAVRVFPPYDGSRLERLFASARVGIAEVQDEISSRLARFDCRYSKTGGRLALRFFEGDVLLASGRWWAGEGRFLSPLLRGQLRRGARIAIVECAGGGLSFCPAPGNLSVENPTILDRRHVLSQAPSLLEGWEHSVPLVLELPGNFRRVVADADTAVPAVLEDLPPDGGAILRVSLSLLSRFDRDPAAPILFERCLAWAIGVELPRWKEVAFRLEGADEIAERLAALGVSGQRKLPSEDKGLLFVAPAQLTREVRDWVAFGGTAAVLVPGSFAEPPARIIDDPATRGLSAGLAKRLFASCLAEDAWDIPALRGRRKELVPGLLDRVDMGEGKAYVLRVGPLDKAMTRPWREFLIQVFTNLGVRCGEVGGDE